MRTDVYGRSFILGNQGIVVVGMTAIVTAIVILVRVAIVLATFVIAIFSVTIVITLGASVAVVIAIVITLGASAAVVIAVAPRSSFVIVSFISVVIVVVVIGVVWVLSSPLLFHLQSLEFHPLNVKEENGKRFVDIRVLACSRTRA